MIVVIAMKGKWIIIFYILQNQILQELHSNHMDIENKTDEIVGVPGLTWIQM